MRGYAIYGPSTMLVLTTGRGVHGFTLDREIGEFMLTHPDLRIPESTLRVRDQRLELALLGSRRSSATSSECQAGAAGPRGRDFNMRWIASLVAETHRILMRGGVFMYPRDRKDLTKAGRLRLLYEANPIGFLIEQAGGRASTGREPLLDVEPESLHQRIGFVFGSRAEVERIERYHREHNDFEYEAPLFGTRNVLAESRVVRGGARMSATHPIIAVTGSSGAGTTSVMRTFEQIFRREQVDGRVHRRRQLPSLRPRGDEAEDGRGARPRRPPRSATSARTRTCSTELEGLFRSYGESGRGQRRKYLHDEQEAAPYGSKPGTFTDWEELPEDTDLLFYEGLHGAVAHGDVDVAQARRPADRRRAGHQPRVDPEAASRPARRAATPPRR